MRRPSEGIEAASRVAGSIPQPSSVAHQCQKEKASRHLCLINYVFGGKRIQNPQYFDTKEFRISNLENQNSQESV
jgi:hypothetical protein